MRAGERPAARLGIDLKQLGIKGFDQKLDLRVAHLADIESAFLRCLCDPAAQCR
jgi:hypothetical protein